MSKDQQQKLLLAILAVLALGAGSYFLFVRDSGGPSQAQVNSGPVQRRERAKKEEVKSTRREAKAKTATARPAAAERREREEAPERAETKRKEKKREKTEVKAKKIAPVG